ncbi:MAG: aminotransferase class III-fold pyridoxal phosphate-dependent enzyme [Gemmatimonas sp.]|nr:aminotransferase class III-fold pyridoxal phosphate-dependent enzyme [Gemmatimonas sp.]
MRSGEVRARHKKFLFPSVSPYYGEPLVLEEGSGVWVRDAEGQEYLDCFSGILTLALGHCHPEVNARVQDQLNELGHTSTLYVTEGQVRVAERLAELAPTGLTRSYFTNSGSEAMETAVMAACLYTGRSEIVALRHCYHGRTYLATNLTAHASWRPLASSIAGLHHARAPYLYRSELAGMDEEEAGEIFARDVEEVIVTCTNGRPAAFLAEPILGVGGYIVPPRGYYRRAAEIVRKYGGLFISDEVQTGFGRTGRWWGIDHWEVEPDIMYMAKGIANGFPVGATMAREEIAEAWTAKSISTFGGNPIAMAAAEATLEVMVRENVDVRCAERGVQLRRGLNALQEQYEWIGEVRGMGLMLALELVEDSVTKEPAPARAQAYLEATKEAGVLVGVAGLHGNVVRLAPSMLITETEVEEAIERLGRACKIASAAA